MATTSTQLLKLALPLVKDYGFTREALSRSVLSLPNPHKAPLMDTGVTALFGEGDHACRMLVNAWFDDARLQMQSARSIIMKDILWIRLKCNAPVLQHLPEVISKAFALLASSSTILPLNPRHTIHHASQVANDACWIAYPAAKEGFWYSQRTSVAAVYLASELHQLTSPGTTYDFLGSLLDTSSAVSSSMDEVALCGAYVLKSWEGILRSNGIL